MRQSKIINRTSKILLVLALSVFALPSTAQETFIIAVVDDGPSDRLQSQQQKYIDELLALTAGEFDVQLRKFSGAWTRQSMEAAIDNAYADSDIDMVLVTGFVSNQFAAIRTEFPKPTFLPVILEIGLLADAPVDGVSGIRNLNYLSAYADFANDLDTLARITDYQKLALFVDANLSSAIPTLRQAAFEKSGARGVELLQITHDGVDHDLMSRVPADTDAIFVAVLPRMPTADFEHLVASINAAGLPSYSFSGVSDVERGLLATNTEPRDIDRQARFNALNMQAVMVGGLAQEQSVASTFKDHLTINMATARRIGLSLSFDVLNDSVLLNQEEEIYGEVFGLVEIAELALAENQDLLAESYGVQAGLEDISSARSSLLPQFGLSASHIVRNDSPSVRLGLLAEESSDAALSFDQLLYSDAASANLTIQKELQRTRLSSFQQFRLDVIQVATTSYYQVLNARSQLTVQENNLRISRANLELAENRVRLGNSTAADVYRWQAEVARAQIVLLDARFNLNQAWETLNRILHRPQGERLVLSDASFDEPFVMTRKEFDQLVRSPADYAKFSRFYIDRALSQSPELAQLDGQIAAKDRELTNRRRAYWLPDFSLSGGYTSNLSQSGLGAGPTAGEGLDDWNVGLQATLPLFSGGLKRANRSKAELELRQLQTLRISTEERVEEQMRIQLHAAQAAYGQIDLTVVAAEASRKNFELVSDAYARGTVTVIELLDAQDTSSAAAAAAAESLHNFLITIMALQRAVGGFDYLLSEQDRNVLAAEFRATITGMQ